MFTSRFMPCPECGASVDRSSGRGHECSSERRADYLMFGMRDEVAQLEAGIQHFLVSSVGRFETWLAAQRVRGLA